MTAPQRWFIKDDGTKVSDYAALGAGGTATINVREVILPDGASAPFITQRCVTGITPLTSGELTAMEAAQDAAAVPALTRTPGDTGLRSPNGHRWAPGVSNAGAAAFTDLDT